MTADVNVNVNVSTSEMEEKCELDIISYEDLPTAAADYNGVKDGNENAKRNGEDDPDASYVFVAGNDVVADEPTETPDLNGKSELIENVGSCDNDIENEVTESDVDPVNGNFKSPAVEAPLNHEFTSNDGGKERENGVIAMSNGAVPIVAPYAHGLDDQEEIGEDRFKLDSPKDIEGTREFEVNFSVAVEPEIQVNVSDVKVGEEDHVRLDLSKDIEGSQFQVNVSLAVEPEIQVNFSDVKVGEEDHVRLDSSKDIEGTREFQVNVSVAVEPEIQVNVGDAKAEEVEEDHVKLDSPKVIEGSQEFQDNASVAVEPEIQVNVSGVKSGEEDTAESMVTQEPQVTTRTDVGESEQNQFGNIEVIAEDKIEDERQSNLVTDIKENQDSTTVITEDFHNENDLDLVEGEEPVGIINNFPVDGPQKASEVQLEKNTERIPCLLVPDIEVQTLISTDAEIGRKETITSDAESGKRSMFNDNDAIGHPASNDNDAIGHPTNEITLSVVRLESETVNGHITYETGETLPPLHAEESISQTSVNLIQTTLKESKPFSEVVKSISVATDSASEPAVEIGVEIGDSCPLDDISVVEKTIDSHPVSDKKEVIEGESCSLLTDTKPTCIDNDVIEEIEMDSVPPIESEEKISTFSSDEVDIESEVLNQAVRCVCSNPASVDDPVPVDVRSEPLTLPSKETSNNDGHAFKSEVLDGCEKTLNCIQDDLGKTPQEMDLNDEFNGEEVSNSCPEASIDASDGQNTVNEVVKRPFYYIIRIPRYDDDENLKEQIKHAQFQVDEKTKGRDVIRAEMQRKRAACNEYGDCLGAAKSEEIAARDLLKAKRKEIDSVLSVINRVKSAFSVEDIDCKIRNMKHMIEHETLPLKEEKNYIREIKQLKQIREQLSSSLGNQEDVQEAIDQKEQVEERLKLLRKEADLLRENVLKAEAATKNAKKKWEGETAKLNELIARFRAADDIRQKEYAHLQSLRKRLYDKNKDFWKYKDDAKAAYDLASKGEKEELQRHCINQVERVMELWNSNDEFRKEYTRCNMRSTLRRLRTLDGRSLGPDEDPPVIPIVVTERAAKGNIISSISTVEGEKTVALVDTEKTDDKSTAKVGERDNPTVKSKKPAKHATMGNGLGANVSGRNEIEKTVVSGQNEIENTSQEEHKQTKEEEELARKAEELRKEEEVARLKEQRRLEEKAKAKEAMERKKRIADKAQARAALRALKEAEQKEKEREKKARKKEKRKALAEDVNSVNEGESAPISETLTETKESEAKEKPMAVTKKPQKPSHFTKQVKSKSIPLPLRNRGKRRIQTWMWVLLTALAVFALFLMGNSSSFFLQRFGF